MAPEFDGPGQSPVDWEAELRGKVPFEYIYVVPRSGLAPFAKAAIRLSRESAAAVFSEEARALIAEVSSADASKAVHQYLQGLDGRSVPVKTSRGMEEVSISKPTNPNLPPRVFAEVRAPLPRIQDYYGIPSILNSVDYKLDMADRTLTAPDLVPFFERLGFDLNQLLYVAEKNKRDSIAGVQRIDVHGRATAMFHVNAPSFFKDGKMTFSSPQQVSLRCYPIPVVNPEHHQLLNAREDLEQSILGALEVFAQAGGVRTI